MKQFNKWWDDNGSDYCDEGGMNYEECAAACWKAALKWVKNNCDLYDRCGGWQGYIVEEELGNDK